MSCSLFIPEIFFKDDKKYTGIDRLDSIDKKRFNLVCIICNTKSKYYIIIIKYFFNNNKNKRNNYEYNMIDNIII